MQQNLRHEYKIDRIAKDYDKERFENPTGRYIQEIQDKFILNLIERKKKVLDLCCGTGRLTIPLSRKGEIWGVDFSPAMLHVLQSKIQRNDSAVRLNIITAEASMLPFVDNLFDYTLCIRAMAHMPHYEKVIAELARVTKSGGRIVVELTNKRSLLVFKPIFDSYYGIASSPQVFSLRAIAQDFRENNCEHEITFSHFVIPELAFRKTPKNIAYTLFKIDAILTRFFHGCFGTRSICVFKKNILVNQYSNVEKAKLN